jgi:hypothetical protein
MKCLNILFAFVKNSIMDEKTVLSDCLEFNAYWLCGGTFGWFESSKQAV